MAAGSTYTPITTTTLSSTSSTVTFSSIPSTYTDLVLVVSGYIPTNGYCLLRVNSDSGANYSRTFLNGNGSTATSGRNSNDTSTYITLSASANGTGIINFMNYANTSTYKTMLSKDADPNNFVVPQVSLWRSTSAINAINMINASSNFAIGTTFTLYGIAAA